MRRQQVCLQPTALGPPPRTVRCRRFLPRQPRASAAAAACHITPPNISERETERGREREREGERGRAEQSADDLGEHRAASGSDDARASDAACSSSSAASSCRSCVCVYSAHLQPSSTSSSSCSTSSCCSSTALDAAHSAAAPAAPQAPEAPPALLEPIQSPCPRQRMVW